MGHTYSKAIFEHLLLKRKKTCIYLKESMHGYAQVGGGARVGGEEG